jgi:phage FluMu protein gp41
MNLWSAIRVANVPFELTNRSVLDQRFDRLKLAELIRCRTKVELREITETEVESVAHEIALNRMSEELKNPEIISRHSEETTALLRRHLADGGFRASSQELLRQVLVICWGAFEILANDTVKALLNAKPKMISRFMEVRPYREFLSARWLMDSLETRNFNLSSTMGEVFCEVVKLDSLEKIREAIRVGLGSDVIDAVLKDERLWKISQQRHLIVHRRGIVDARYIERTSGNETIGGALMLEGQYIEGCLEVVRDVGCKIFSTAYERLSEGA